MTHTPHVRAPAPLLERPDSKPIARWLVYESCNVRKGSQHNKGTGTARGVGLKSGCESGLNSKRKTKVHAIRRFAGLELRQNEAAVGLVYASSLANSQPK